MRIFITFLGRSIWALINGYYAISKHKGYFPDLIYIITEDLFKDNLEKTETGLKIISEEFGFTPKIEKIIMNEEEFFQVCQKINVLIKNLKNKGHTIAVDITPGRKPLIISTLISLSKIDVDHIFYLAIKTIKDVDRPYEMIPRQIQSLKDFIEELKVVPTNV